MEAVKRIDALFALEREINGLSGRHALGHASLKRGYAPILRVGALRAQLASFPYSPAIS